MRARRLLIVFVAAGLWISPVTSLAVTDSRPATETSATDHGTASHPRTDSRILAIATAETETSVTPPANPDTQSWWQVLVAELLKLVLLIFVPVLSTLVVTLLKRWNLGIEFDQVNSIARQAAGWAEQMAEVALKEGYTKTPGAEKMAMAIKFGNELADKYKLPAKATEKLQDLIEAALGQEKIKVETVKKAAQPDEVTA